MKILLLTPGTGNFHCGSCLHDEVLVRGLRNLGHDAAINALYLPLVLDHKEGIDGDTVQMGGINMYLQTKSALFRHAPSFVERLLDRPGLLRKAANRADMTSPDELGRMTEQMLLGKHGKTKHEIDRLIQHLRQTEAPDVVLLNNALLLGLAAPIADALNCSIACTLQGEDTFIDGLPESWRERVWSLLTDCAKQADAFLPVSEYHGQLMAERLSLPGDKLHVAYNGIETDRYPAITIAPDPPVIGYLARLCETKGLGDLIDAYLLLHERGQLGDARLHLVGAATPKDAQYATQQTRRLTDAGLGDRVTLQQNVSFDEKVAALQGMSVLSVPATYGESFGLYVIEANACGVPAVEPDHAGLTEVMGQTGGGILYKPGDQSSLAKALASLLNDEPRRQSLGAEGRASVLERFSTSAMSRSVASILETTCKAPSR